MVIRFDLFTNLKNYVIFNYDYIYNFKLCDNLGLKIYFWSILNL